MSTLARIDVVPALSDPVAAHELATLAAACLLIDDARIHGLIDAGPEIDRARCRRVIGQAHAEGFIVDQDEVSAAALSLMAELGVLRP